MTTQPSRAETSSALSASLNWDTAASGPLPKSHVKQRLSPITLVALLAAVLVSGTGCSSMREDPTDAFAPRPENATSASYQIVRLDEDPPNGMLNRTSLLAKISRYRSTYRTIETRSDFGQDYYEEHRYRTYQMRLQSFQDSDLAAAERYLQSLPESITFVPTDSDDQKYDIGDIDWTAEQRALRVVDFYAQNYSDDWSPYAFVINLIPTARDGYGKLSLSIAGETLSFRRAMRKRLWTFSSGYFWVYTRLLRPSDTAKPLPMLVVIADPNNRGEMNGTYLIMPRIDTSTAHGVTDASRTNQAQPTGQTQPTGQATDDWNLLSNERIQEARVIIAERRRGMTTEKLVSSLKVRGSDQSDEMLRQLISLYEQDSARFEQRVESLRKELEMK
jgi:hypothetical protein